MNLYFFIPQNILGFINFIGGVYLICILFNRKKELPYKNISSFWIRNILMISVIYQIVSSTLYILFNLVDFMKDYLYQGRAFIRDYLGVIFIFAVLERCYSLSYCIDYNYDKLSKVFSDTPHSTVLDISFYKRQFDFTKTFLVLCILYSIGFAFIFGYGRNTYYSKNEDYFEIYVPITSGIYLILICIICHFIYNAVKYPLVHDKIKIKLELYMIGFFFIVFYETRYILFVFLKLSIEEFSFLLDSILIFFLVILYSVLSFHRNKYNETYKSIFEEDFISFIRRDISFKIYKQYVLKRHEDEFKYLLFYSDFMVYKDIATYSKQQINQLINEKKQQGTEMTHCRKKTISSSELLFDMEEQNYMHDQENNIVLKAKQIFTDYFSNYERSSNINEKSIQLAIDFPIDIYDKLDELYQNNFAVENIENIFDDASIWVVEKMTKIYEEFKNLKEERSNMERILFFFDSLEIPL